jgi:ligand-binding SRPBCC domain-containing protein
VQHLLVATRIAAPPEQCFRLSLSVDAHLQSMGRSRERAVAGVTTGLLALGDTVTWRARHGGIPFRMTVTITEHEPPSRFVDEQVRGPFGSWRHEHRFVATAGGTSMVDEVEFASPYGVVGRVVDRLVLRRYVRRLLVARNAWLTQALEG